MSQGIGIGIENKRFIFIDLIKILRKSRIFNDSGFWKIKNIPDKTPDPFTNHINIPITLDHGIQIKIDRNDQFWIR